MKTPRDRRDRAVIGAREPGPSGGAKRRASSSGSAPSPSRSVSRLTSYLPARDRRPPGADLVSARDQDFGVVWQEEVHSRAELDHSDALPAPETFSNSGIEHDAGALARRIVFYPRI